jgi:hypothetical protein
MTPSLSISQARNTCLKDLAPRNLAVKIAESFEKGLQGMVLRACSFAHAWSNILTLPSNAAYYWWGYLLQFLWIPLFWVEWVMVQLVVSLTQTTKLVVVSGVDYCVAARVQVHLM